MTATLDLTADVDLLDVLRAPLAVACPKCQAKPGYYCESTGGGNRAYVPTHKTREARVDGWVDGFAAAAGRLVKSVLQLPFAERDAADWLPFELTAKPFTPKPAVSPESVYLSPKQARAVEQAAENDGLYAPTSHFHGDAQRRQTVNALEAKGILESAGSTPDGYGREMRLTAFGWQVYRQHPQVIRRLDEEEITRREAGHDDGEGGS